MLGAVVLLVGGAQVRPALAHDRLVDSGPASGAAVAVPPTSVWLRFNAPSELTTSTIIVTDPEGIVRSAGPVGGTPARLSQSVTPGGPPGRWSVVYRVVSTDGHPITSTFGFVVRNAAPSRPSPTAAPSSPAAEASTEALLETRPTGQSGNGSSPLPVLAGGGVGVLALGLVARSALLQRRRRA